MNVSEAYRSDKKGTITNQYIDKDKKEKNVPSHHVGYLKERYFSHPTRNHAL
jgi:hypothetical protein